MTDERADWVRARMEDLSGGETVAFALACGLCGTKNRTMPAMIDPLIEARKDVYQAEYEQAIEDFCDILTKCPACGRFVCEQCVRFDDRGHLCAGCAENAGGGDCHEL